MWLHHSLKKQIMNINKIIIIIQQMTAQLNKKFRHKFIYKLTLDTGVTPHPILEHNQKGAIL